ncbi:MAG: M20/M25/M40 family metallo-hydrolase [Pseudomonadota bacterium]
MRRILLGSLAIALGLVAILIIRALSIGSADPVAAFPAISEAVDRDQLAGELAEALKVKTISAGEDAPPSRQSLNELHTLFRETYPGVYRTIELTVMPQGTLIYRWKGSDPNRKPFALLGHQDVVPVEEATLDEWTHPPYGGVIDNGIIYGRGTLDNKGQVIAILSAAERLIARNFTPDQDIYFIFGHDEEIGGDNGAAAAVRYFKENNIQFEFALDEGSGVVQGLIPGTDAPFALISLSEKGSTTLRLTGRAPGGHSAAPGKDTAVSVVSRAMVAITDDPFPQKLDPVLVDFLHELARNAPFAQRIVLANLWLFGPQVVNRLGNAPSTAAALHTTTAPTIISGGEKLNILPQSASAVVNFRIHPRDTVESVRLRTERVVNDDRITIETLGGREPTGVSSKDSRAFNAIASTTAEVFGPIPTTPFLTLQGTDARHYETVADDVYRFAPFIFGPKELERIHGTDEQVSVENLARASSWYEAFMEKTAGKEGVPADQ